MTFLTISQIRKECSHEYNWTFYTRFLRIRFIYAISSLNKRGISTVLIRYENIVSWIYLGQERSNNRELATKKITRSGRHNVFEVESRALSTQSRTQRTTSHDCGGAEPRSKIKSSFSGVFEVCQSRKRQCLLQRGGGPMSHCQRSWGPPVSPLWQRGKLFIVY